MRKEFLDYALEKFLQKSLGLEGSLGVCQEECLVKFMYELFDLFCMNPQADPERVSLEEFLEECMGA